MLLARWPHLLVGAMGVVWLGFESWRAYRGKQPPAMFGVGMAWFSLAVGGLIAIVRYTYFNDFPDQLLAPRYVVWSSLFWAGLGMAAVVQAKRAAVALGPVLMVAILLIPSQAWMAKLGEGMRVSLSARLWGRRWAWWKRAATGRKRAWRTGRGTAGPASRQCRSVCVAGSGDAGKPVPMGTRYLTVVRDIEATTVGNQLGDRGRRVSFILDDVVPPDDHLLLVDADGVARGLAMRDPEDRRRWIGWMSGEGDAAAPRVALLPTS